MDGIIETGTLRAMALAAAGDEAEAVAVLAGILVPARPQGYVRGLRRPGAADGRTAQRLISAQRADQMAARVPLDYLARLQRAFGAGPAAMAPDETRPRCPASSTCLPAGAGGSGDDGSGRSDQAIARELVVALDTVKKVFLSMLDNSDRLLAMSPRPAPDLDLRRDQVIRSARDLAESDGWAAVTMRRLAGELGVTQPVLYSAFASRQALIDAVALNGFGDLAAALEAVDASPMARMRAYLDFAAAHPRVYEAMFLLPSGLAFATDDSPEPLQRAFWGIRDAFPDGGETHAEVAWSTLHGLATLQASGRLRPSHTQARLDLAHRMLTQQETR